MNSQSLSAPTAQEHEEIRRKYTSLAWQLARDEFHAHHFVRHPLPEEHLRIEVVMFWRGEITKLSGWNDPIGQLIRWLLDQVQTFITWIWNNIMRPVIDAIVGAARAVLEGLINGVRWVVDSIAGTLSAVWTWLQSAIGYVGSFLSEVWTSILNVVNAVGSAVASGVAWIGGELTKATSWIWEQFQGFFSAIGEVLKQIGTWIINAIKTYVVDPLLNLLGAVFEGLKSLITAVWNFITGGAIAGSPIEWRGSFLRWIGIISGVGVMAVSGLIGAELVNLLHPFKDTKAGEIAKFAIQFSGVAFLQAAFFTTYFDIACAKPVRQELNAIFTPEIPGSADLIRFVVREVIVPDEFHLAMGLQGFSKYWSDAYWEAHWVLPPTERTRTAFLRKLISEEEYRRFLIWYDFKPEPRPGISKSDVDLMLATQYDYPGRIETRWLIEWGIITPEQGVELLKAAGADPAWAPKELEAILLNQLRDELAKVRAVFDRRLRAGFMKKEDYAAALTGIHYAPHVVNTLMKWADEELTLDEILDLAKEYEVLAKEEIITPTAYAQALRDLGMTEERITRAQKQIERILAVKAMKAAAKAKPVAGT